MKENLLAKLTEEGKENSNAIREELRADFQAQFDAKEQEMKARFEQEKEAMMIYFQSKLDEKLAKEKEAIIAEARTANVDTVVSASTKILNEVMVPAMEQHMATKLEVLKVQMKEDIEQETRREIEEKVRLQMAVTKSELETAMHHEVDEKIIDVKAESKVEFEQHIEDKINEKQEESKVALKVELESVVKEEVSNEMARQKEVIKNELITEVDEKVIFAAVRSSSGNVEPGEIITYDTLTANIGEAMVASSGTFKAPKKGLYAFTLSANSDNTKSGMVIIKVLKNGSTAFFIDDEATHHTEAKEKNISYYWMLDLSENDTVALQVNKAEGHNIIGLHADASADWVHFTGQLLHAN